MKTYIGQRSGEFDRKIVVKTEADVRMLEPRLDLRYHSPTGFEWGYEGSGPAQLALAILADHFQNDDEALRKYQDFKRNVVSKFPREAWKITEDEIRALVD